jgi:hypothetical protein
MPEFGDFEVSCTFELLSRDLWRLDEGPYRDSCIWYNLRRFHLQNIRFSTSPVLRGPFYGSSSRLDRTLPSLFLCYDCLLAPIFDAD